MPATVRRKKSTAKARRPKKSKMIYAFGPRKTEGRSEWKELLGGKGANLADMTSIGLPVPPGFTITTETCGAYSASGNRMPAGCMDEVRQHVGLLEKTTGKTFGSKTDPLLVSVRSGAAVSMPGMMDTVLNLGLTDAAVEGLVELTDRQPEICMGCLPATHQHVR